jgi:hypothetical protein
MNALIEYILSKFCRPLSRLNCIHYNDYRYLLPESVNRFKLYQKYRHNDESYDLYGWNDNTLIDIYPTYKNIITKEDLPKSWINYSKLILNVTSINKYKILIYNKKYNKFTNVIDIDTEKENINITTNHKITNDWVKATGIKNYMMDDTIIDIINKNSTEQEKNINIEKTEQTEETELFNELLAYGNDFERDIIDILIQKYYMNFVKICESYQAKDINKYNYTLSEMNKGTPIIHQAVLHDPESKIYGCVDLLVRSDWINKIFKNFELENSLINDKPYYVVIDIKFHRLQYNTDGKTLRNEGMMKVFKSQLYIYNKALGYMQKYTPNNAYILGRGWIKSNIEKGIVIIEKNNDPFDKLGVIDFIDKDNDIKIKSEEALKWLHELKNNNFDETKPKYDHSYPNMTNNMSITGRKRKLSIAEDKNELTLLSYVGVKHRKIGISNGIDNYMNENLNAEKLGLTGKTEKIINTLIDNQRNLDKPIKGNYKCPEKQAVEVFLDFEYMYSFDQDENIPYLCGIGYIINSNTTLSNLQSANSNNTTLSNLQSANSDNTTLSNLQSANSDWNFNYVLLDDISIASRDKMCQNIIELLENINATHIYTWSGVDKRLLLNECKKFNLCNKISNIEWIDMYDFCLNNYINFKGAKRYGLKEIGKTIYTNNLTNIYWKKNLSSSSTVGAKKHYFKNIKWNPINIIDYNETDCRMIYEILYNLRKYQN